LGKWEEKVWTGFIWLRIGDQWRALKKPTMDLGEDSRRLGQDSSMPSPEYKPEAFIPDPGYFLN
jgi:hypothetical protein